MANRIRPERGERYPPAPLSANVRERVQRIIAEPRGLFDRATDVLRLLGESYYSPSGLGFSPIQRSVMTTPARGQREQHKIVLRLHAVCRRLGLSSPVNLHWCLPKKGTAYYGMSTRRCLERIAGARSWRYVPGYRVEDNRSPQQKEIIGVQSRFAVLCNSLYGTDVQGDDWLKTDDYRPSEVNLREVTIEERRYVTSAEANETRRRLRLPPKNRCSVLDDQYKSVVQKVEQNRLGQSLGRTLETLSSEVRSCRSDDELHTTLVRFYFAFERWHHHWLSAGGRDIRPGPDFIVDPFYDARRHIDPG